MLGTHIIQQGGTAKMKKERVHLEPLSMTFHDHISPSSPREVAFKWYSVVRDFIGLFFFPFCYCRKDTTVVRSCRPQTLTCNNYFEQCI